MRLRRVVVFSGLGEENGRVLSLFWEWKRYSVRFARYSSFFALSDGKSDDSGSSFYCKGVE